MNTPARIPGLYWTKHFQLRVPCKVADKSERSSMGILGAFWTFFISVTGIKFPIWIEDKIRPAYRAEPVTGLIWRGPNWAIEQYDLSLFAPLLGTQG